METRAKNTIDCWTRHVYLNGDVNDTRVTIRPIEHRDAILEEEFIRHLSDIALRKLSRKGTDEFTPDELLELCRVDYRDSMAFIATTRIGTEVREIGVARYSKDTDPDVHEAAVIVANEYRHSSLTEHLLDSLIRYAQQHGVLIIKIVDYYDNLPLKHLAKKLKMTPSGDVHDPHRVVYTMSLSTIVT